MRRSIHDARGGKPFTLGLLGLIITCCTNSVAHATGVERSPSGTFGFEENRGQFTDMHGHAVPQVLYVAQGRGSTVYLTDEGLTYVFGSTTWDKDPQRITEEELLRGERPKGSTRKAWVDLCLEGASIRQDMILAEEPGDALFHYYLSAHPEGITGLRRHHRITVREVYPGIDWVLYGAGADGLKYDLVVHPGADPSRISLLYAAAESGTLQEDGSLLLRTAMGDLREHAPLCYLPGTGGEVPSRFVREPIDAHRIRVRFALDEGYPCEETLVIDPQLHWSTYASTESTDVPLSLATNSAGDLIVLGYHMDSPTQGFPYPVSGPPYSGAYATAQGTGYLRAFNSDGVLLWSTLYEGLEQFGSLVVDAAGRITAAGMAVGGMPTQPGTGSRSGAYYDPVFHNGLFESDAYILSFSPQGMREWATYLGGWRIESITSDAAGRIVAAGFTDDLFTPDQPPVGSFVDADYLPVPNDNTLWLLGFAANGALEWSSGYADDLRSVHVRFRPSGDFLLTGRKTNDAGALPILATGAFASATTLPFNGNGGSSPCDGYIAGFTSAGQQIWGCFYDLENSQACTVTGLATGPDGQIVIAGITAATSFNGLSAGFFEGAYVDSTPNFQGTPGTVADLKDPVVFGFNPQGVLQWATLLGGSSIEQVFANDRQQVAIDSCGTIHVAYATFSADCPLLDPGCGGFHDNTYANTGSYMGDVVLHRFIRNGAMTWGSYFGGTGDEITALITTNRFGDLLAAVRTTGEPGNGIPLADPGGGAYFQNITAADDDVLMVRLKPTACEATSCSPFLVTGSTTHNACPGECSATASVEGQGGTPPYSYAWSNGQSSATITGLCASTCTVTCTDANGAVSTATFTVWEPLPMTPQLLTTPSSCTLPTGSAYVLPDSTTINSSFGGTPDGSFALGPYGYDWLWSTGQTDVDSIGGLGVGSYMLTVTDALGCVHVEPFTIAPLAQPTASVSALTTELLSGESTTLFAAGGTSYSWSPTAGLSCTTCQSPTANPADTTTYCVTVFDADLCSDTACVTLNVTPNTPPPPPCGEVFVPNAFSPDGSGANDTHCVLGDCIATLAFSIFDRWGNLVFETSDPKTCWDGTRDGQALDPAVFVYHLRATLTTGDVVEKSGNITLFR